MRLAARLLQAGQLDLDMQPAWPVYAGHQFSGYSPNSDGQPCAGQLAPDGQHLRISHRGRPKTPLSRWQQPTAMLPQHPPSISPQRHPCLSIPVQALVLVTLTGRLQNGQQRQHSATHSARLPCTQPHGSFLQAARRRSRPHQLCCLHFPSPANGAELFSSVVTAPPP